MTLLPHFLFLLLINSVQSTIKIIGTGTGRTGSTTLHEALSILGFKTYHMKEFLMGGSQRAAELDFWFDAFRTNCSHPEQLRDILETNGYTATVHAINFPCHDALLFDLYPEAKVIHTERTSAELWHDSVSNSICNMNDSWFVHIMGMIFPIFKRFKQFTPILMGRAVFGVYTPVENVTKDYCLEHKQQMIDFYNAHNAHIKKIVPKDRLLVISNHKGGWDTICQFLGVPIPDVPFPHVNKRDSMLKSMLTIMANKFDNFSPVVRVLVIFPVLLPFCALLNILKRKVSGESKKSKAE